MNRPQKIVIGIAIALGLLMAATVTWAGATVVRDGLITVRISEAGPHGAQLYLPIPGTAVRAVLRGVRWNGLERERLRRQLAEAAPTIRALGDALAGCPDARLVEVESRGQHVTVDKRGGSLRITIDDGGDHVEVTFPLDLAQEVLRSLSA